MSYAYVESTNDVRLGYLTPNGSVEFEHLVPGKINRVKVDVLASIMKKEINRIYFDTGILKDVTAREALRKEEQKDFRTIKQLPLEVAAQEYAKAKEASSDDAEAAQKAFDVVSETFTDEELKAPEPEEFEFPVDGSPTPVRGRNHGQVYDVD